MNQTGVRAIAYLCVLAMVFPQAAPADAPRSGTVAPNADALIGGMIDRTLPGGHAVFDGNTNLRKPSSAEAAARLHAFSDFHYDTQARQASARGLVIDGRNPAQLKAVQAQVAAVGRDIHARGASRERLARWAVAISPLFEYLDQLRKQRMAANLRAGKPVQLMPGDTLTFQLAGYCMDHNLGTATSNEPMALRPLDDLMPNELQPVFLATLRYGQRHPDVPLQGLVWFFRGLGTSRIAPTDFPLYAGIVNAAYPNGWNLIVAWNNDQVDRASRKTAITNLATGVLRRSGLQPVVQSATDAYARLAQTASSVQALRQAVNTDIARIQATPVAGNVPTDLSGFSRTANGLDVVAASGTSSAVGPSTQSTSGWLQTTGVMRNDTMHPITVDPAVPLVAQAERPTQRNIGIARYGIAYDPVSPAEQGAVDSDIDQDAFGLSKDLRDKVGDIIGTPADVCTILGLPMLKKNFAKGRDVGVRKAVSAAIGIANIVKIAVTGNDLRGEPAPPVEAFTDRLLVLGGAFLGVVALPVIIPAGIAIADGATLATALDIAIPAEMAELAAGAGEATEVVCDVTGAAAGVWDIANHSDALSMWNAFDLTQP